MVLTREEVRAVVQQIEDTPRLMAYLLYGAGLRVLELEAVREQHQGDPQFGAGWVELPTAPMRKYPNAGREWA